MAACAMFSATLSIYAFALSDLCTSQIYLLMINPGVRCQKRSFFHLQVCKVIRIKPTPCSTALIIWNFAFDINHGLRTDGHEGLIFLQTKSGVAIKPALSPNTRSRRIHMRFDLFSGERAEVNIKPNIRARKTLREPGRRKFWVYFFHKT